MAESAPAANSQPAPAGIPTGDVAFLFTDIEGSTKRWEHRPEAMKAAVARHDLLMRQAIVQHDGYVFKTVGDAFCAAFVSPHHALRAAIAAQRALRSEDFAAVEGLSVRIGIHAGIAEERDGDYFGPTVNRVARLMSIGHGGQVLVSDAVRERIEGHLTGDMTLIDLGLRRLKDLMRPEHVWQVTIAGLPSDFAPLMSLDARPNNLPIQTTPLLGRETELTAVKHLLASHQCVTISGAGGVGKTRLAVQVGADLIDHYEHGIWFADLAPIADAGLVPSVIARALEVAQSGDPVETSVIDWIKRKALLLIFDNCEHLLTASAAFVDAVLKNCSQVRVLTTSRQPLGIAGEFVYRLPSLEVPEPSATITAADLSRFGATALFIDRATASDSRFVLQDDSAGIVVDICRRLDGIPLAIELAAARVKVLSFRSLAARLDERFKVLTGGSRTALPRQQTLVALIDWSYGLLEPREQALFNRLGIFAGSFTFDAAVAVGPRDNIDESDVLELLSSLTDKSLIFADTSREQERYRLLESTRAYALEKLRMLGESEMVAGSHATFYRDFARAAYRIQRTRPTEAWLPDQEPELDNLRSALGWALQEGNDPELGAEIAGACVELWMAAGLAAEARDWVTLALERIDPSVRSDLAAPLWLMLSSLGSSEQCYDLALRAREVFERADDRAGVADASYAIAWQAGERGRYDEASEALAQAIEVYRGLGSELQLARCIGMQGMVAEHREDFDSARTFHREAVVKFRALGDERRVGAVLTNLGGTEFLAGNYAEARRIFADALEIIARRKNIRDIAILQVDIAFNLVPLGDIAGAREATRIALTNAFAIQNEAFSALILLLGAYIAARSDRIEDAARLYGYACRRLEVVGLPTKIEVNQAAQWLRPLLAEKFERPEVVRLMAEGATWTEQQAFDVALHA